MMVPRLSNAVIRELQSRLFGRPGDRFGKQGHLVRMRRFGGMGAYKRKSLFGSPRIGSCFRMHSGWLSMPKPRSWCSCHLKERIWAILLRPWVWRVISSRRSVSSGRSSTTSRQRGEEVSASEKVVSFFEEHTDIIVKGWRDTQYGHKVF